MRKRDLLKNICGVSEYTTKTAIHKFNSPSQTFEKKAVGRPRQLLDREYSSVVEDIILYNNENDQISTVRREVKSLEESFHLKILYSILLRDLHTLGFKYERGIRRNILHDAQTNVHYRGTSVKQRLANINGKMNPNYPEVFLDELYCHVDHSTGKT